MVFFVEVELVEAEVEVEVGLEAEADLADWLLLEVEEDWEEALDGFWFSVDLVDFSESFSVHDFLQLCSQ